MKITQVNCIALADSVLRGYGDCSGITSYYYQ